jgi:hypothetical protein
MYVKWVCAMLLCGVVCYDEAVLLLCCSCGESVKDFSWSRLANWLLC